MQKTQKINTPKRLEMAMSEFWDNSSRKQKIEMIPIFCGFFYGLCYCSKGEPSLDHIREALVGHLPELEQVDADLTAELTNNQ